MNLWERNLKKPTSITPIKITEQLIVENENHLMRL